jgi:hypothetical protein
VQLKPPTTGNHIEPLINFMIVDERDKEEKRRSRKKGRKKKMDG